LKFDETNKVIIETMNRSEAVAFCKFLTSECSRHLADIDQATQLKLKVIEKFSLGREDFQVDRRGTFQQGTLPI